MDRTPKEEVWNKVFASQIMVGTVFEQVFANKDLLAVLKGCWRVTNYFLNRTAQEAVKPGHKVHLSEMLIGSRPGQTRMKPRDLSV